MSRLWLTIALFLSLTAAATGQDPHWLWTSADAKDNDTAFFRKTIELKAAPKQSLFVGSCDNLFTLFIGGQQVVQHGVWEEPLREDVTKHLKAGKNQIAIRGINQGGPAAFLCLIAVEYADGSKQTFVTDGSWLCSSEGTDGWQKADFDDSVWKKPHVIGKLGIGPWNISIDPSKPAGALATSEENIKTLPGFKVELIYSVPKGEQGSWVNMTSDNKGRLIVCDQYGALYRVTPPPVGQVPSLPKTASADSGQVGNLPYVEQIDIPLGEAQGLLYAYDALYVVVNGHGKYESGLYRVTDTNGDDKFDKVEQLKKIQGGGEHGPHAVRLGPDGKLYVIAGNHTRVPDGLDPASPHRNWAEDLLLPRNPDGNGHATGVMAPGGWICRTDKDGKSWEIFCAGFRNEFDIDFNADGELFTYDADMEWDTGTPWYRPTRVSHCVSGGEFGWRYGTGKWPEYSADSLGAVVNIGLGSPTGIEFGTGAKFPAKYQKALFICDWTYGKLYAVHMTPSGASYTGTFETFVEGKPLPLTDAVIHTDGHLYFTIGGRRTQSGLYRVTYVGKESTSPAAAADDAGPAAARALRRRLEALHKTTDPAAVDFAWPHLGSPDRSLRYAARVAVEHQDLKQWQEKALAETRPTAIIELMIALARSGAKDDAGLQSAIVEKLNALPLARLTEEQLLAAARAYALTFIRQGQPPKGTGFEATRRLKPLFPHQSDLVNREIASLLVYLQSPAVVDPAMKLLAEGQTQEDQLYYVFILRNIAHLLSADQKRAYFSWLNLAEANYRGGASFKKFVQQIRKDAAEKLSDADRTALKDVLEGRQNVAVVKLETTRQFVHNWQVEDIEPLLSRVDTGRSFEKGKAAYLATQCAKCHRFAGDGGDTGPDITGVGNRFDSRYILEAMILPSKVISDQYQQHVFLLDNGQTVTGRVVDQDPQTLKVRTDPFARELATITRSEIEQQQPSKVSEMPQGLLNTLTKEEVLDLITYLRAAGNPSDKAFAP